MNIPTLLIPERLNLSYALGLSRQIISQPDDLRFLALDFSRLNWVTPFGMLLVAQSLQQIKKRCPQITIVPTAMPDNDAETYAAHMGFFQACEIELGKQPGEAKGSPTYLPITQKSTSDLIVIQDAAALGFELARKLAQQIDGVLVKTLAFSFCEIIRNVIEHSRSRDFWYCAQYWPARGEAEIALVDSGIGLLASLSDNPHLRPHLLDDRAALKYALMPGISGKMYAGKRSDPDNPWENTGYGLYMNYRICNEGGNFFIATGNTALYRKKGDDNQYFDYGLPGVALRLRMRTETLESYEQHYHDLFLADGEREASKIKGGIIPTGDKMSQMLRGGFTSISSKDDQ